MQAALTEVSWTWCLPFLQSQLLGDAVPVQAQKTQRIAAERPVLFEEKRKNRRHIAVCWYLHMRGSEPERNQSCASQHLV